MFSSTKGLLTYWIDCLKQFFNIKASPKHLRLGKLGENFACKELKAQNYKIIARNWRENKHEIDILAQDGECLVFVEVRTRQSSGLQSPEQSFSSHKSRLFQKAAQYYLYKNNCDCPYRFDFVAVSAENNKLVAKVYQNVIRK